MFIKFYLVKLCPIFVGTQLSCLARYQKILWEYSFGCKNLLNFTCHTMKFHNCHHPNVAPLLIYNSILFQMTFLVGTSCFKHLFLRTIDKKTNTVHDIFFLLSNLCICLCFNPLRGLVRLLIMWVSIFITSASFLSEILYLGANGIHF